MGVTITGIAEDLTYKVYADGVIVEEVSFTLEPGEVIQITKPADGTSYGIESNQVASYKQYI